MLCCKVEAVEAVPPCSLSAKCFSKFWNAGAAAAKAAGRLTKLLCREQGRGATWVGVRGAWARVCWGSVD